MKTLNIHCRAPGEEPVSSRFGPDGSKVVELGPSFWRLVFLCMCVWCAYVLFEAALPGPTPAVFMIVVFSFFGVLLLTPIWIICGFWFLWWIARGGELRVSVTRVMLTTPAIALVCFVVWAVDVPERVVFATSKSAFDGAVANIEGGRGARTGMYGLIHVDDIRTGPEESVYFHTGTSFDWIDSYHYGYAYKPHVDGSPWGAKDYQIWSLGDEWYMFMANDDYGGW